MPGRQPTGPIPLLSKPSKPKSTKRKKQRSLNALAIAEKTNSERTKIQRHRLGKSEPDGNFKRKRDIAQNDDSGGLDNEDELERNESAKTRKAESRGSYGETVDYGSDSDGNEWMLGGVQSGNDDSLDSDAAMGESDEEKFEGFIFRGSSSTPGGKQSRRAAEEEGVSRVIDLSEGQGNGELDDDFGEDGMDMAAVLDAGSEDENEDEVGGELAFAGSDEEAASQLSAEEESGLSLLEEENDAQDPAKLASLISLATTMNEQDALQAPKQRIPDSNEFNVPSEYGLSSKQKLTVADLLPSVTDHQLKKSLRILAEKDTKSSIKRSGIAKKLDVPLPKRQQNRLDRKAAYEKSKETLNRWIDTVKHNRRAEHLSFPLQDPDAVNAQSSKKIDRHIKPLTELELAIQNILHDSGLAPADGKTEEDQIRAFEELEANKMPLAEVQARRAELRRSRDLLFREELKAKRINKIKSKSYRRIHRKERERLVQKDKEALAAAGVEDSESEKEKNDRRRAEERMGAKHRESRWAKGVKESGRMTWDEDARGGIEEMARREETLKRRILGRGADSSNEEESSEGEGEEDVEGEIAQSTRKLQERIQGLEARGDASKAGVKASTLALSSMKFMQNAEAARKASNDEAVRQMQRELAGEETPSEEEAEERAGRHLYGPTRSVTQSTKPTAREQYSEFEERLISDEEVEGVAAPDADEVQIVVDGTGSKKSTGKKEPVAKRKKAKEANSSSAQPSGAMEDNPWLSGGKPKYNRRDGRAYDAREAAIVSNELPDSTWNAAAGKPLSDLAPKAVKAANLALTKSGPVTASVMSSDDSNFAEEEETEEKKDEPFVLDNAELVRQAFAGDDVMAKFEKEKEQRMESEDEKVVDKTLTGWGHWTGAGIGKKAQGRNKNRVLSKQEGIPKAQRQDAKLEKVIINEKRVKKNAKYLASQLPHPFETRQQYERSLRLPVGPEWTTKETFQAATKPRVLMKQGIITPMAKPMI
ncbi:MAG: hypothetical protein L6R40_005140 [Gallowayella cf. fulva]|nr:MAG: hypothetical protein L6R40_005140 [Xanthomendoza cf. fulva]